MKNRRRAASADGRPGRGGNSRGRADAPLDYANNSPELGEALKAKKLDSKMPVSREWTVVGVTRADPKAAPIEAREPGSARIAGEGEAAWRRKLAPRHRDAVKRFFGGGEAK